MELSPVLAILLLSPVQRSTFLDGATRITSSPLFILLGMIISHEVLMLKIAY